MPVNELLAEGFDMQYAAQFSKPALNDSIGPHFTDQHVHIAITWPYKEKEGRFGNGSKLIRVIQKKDCTTITDIEDVCILEPGQRLQRVTLSEVPGIQQPQVILDIAYGPDCKNVQHQRYPIATSRSKLLH